MSQVSWMISLIPDSIFVWIYYLLFTAGVGLYVVSKLVKWIPMVNNYKFPAEIAGILLFGLAAYLLGGYGNEMGWRARVAEMEAKVKVAEEKSQQVVVQVQEKIVYKTKIVKQRETVYVDRIKEIAKEVDAKCEIDPRVIEAINNASEDPNKGATK